MTNLLLTFILACLLVSMAGALLLILYVRAAFRRYEAMIAEYRQIMVDFITPEAEGKPSKLGLTVEAWSEIFSRSLVARIKTTLMGLQSGISRGERAAAGDAAEAALSDSPLSALGNIPGVRRSLRKNPGLADIALQYLLPRFLGGVPGGSTPPGGNHSAADAPKFRL